jgi:hypothetical protein
MWKRVPTRVTTATSDDDDNNNDDNNNDDDDDDNGESNGNWGDVICPSEKRLYAKLGYGFDECVAKAYPIDDSFLEETATDC